MVPLRGNLPAFEDIKLNDRDQARLKRFKEFNDTGSGYAIEHGTRPSTIGFALAASPIALAAWVGEKLHEWTDKTPSMEVVLQWLTLYWLTQTFPTSIYPYRHTMHEQKDPTTRPGESAKDFTKPMTGTYVDKPMGYSLFEYELLPTPISWAKKTGNLVSFAEHEYGESEGLSQWVIDLWDLCRWSFCRDGASRFVGQGCGRVSECRLARAKAGLGGCDRIERNMVRPI